MFVGLGNQSHYIFNTDAAHSASLSHTVAFAGIASPPLLPHNDGIRHPATNRNDYVTQNNEKTRSLH